MRELGKYFITNKEYHGDKEFLSSSIVKIGLQGSLAFKHNVIDGLGERKQTKAKDFGSAVHTLILEPHNWDNEVFIFDGETTATGLLPKKASDEIAKNHPNKLIITQGEYELACRMRNNCQQDSKVRDLLFKDDGENEVSYFTHCSRSGMYIKVRLDRGIPSRAIIIDLKTAENVDYFSFSRAVKYDWHYDLSAFMYILGVLEATGVLCEYYWIVLGKAAYAPVAVYKASEKTLSEGSDKYDRAMNNIKRAYELKPNERLFYQDEIGEM